MRKQAQDPCEKLLSAYTACCEVKREESGGLRDGNECKLEAGNYKSCRVAERVSKLDKGTSQNPLQKPAQERK